MTPSPRFVIVHGWENRRPADHWQHWLFDQLESRGLDVDYPQLPVPDEPELDTWLAVLDGLISRGGRPVTLVVHSLGASLWLTHLARGGSTGLVTRVAMVALPSSTVLGPTVVSAFVEHPPLIDVLPGIEQLVIEGEGDEYSPRGVRDDYAIDPAIPVELIAGGGHLTPASGFGAWPRILDWVLQVPS